MRLYSLPLLSFLLFHSLCSGDWMCTFCRSLTNPEIEYNCDDDPPNKKDKTEQGLSPEDQRVSS